MQLESLERLAKAAWYDEGRDAMVVDVLTWNELLGAARKEVDGLMEPPVDADGVPWHLGDTATDVGGHGQADVTALILMPTGWSVELEDGSWPCADQIKHKVPDTWERIIEDAILRGYNEPHAERGGYLTKESLVARCVALAGGAQ